MFKLKERLKNRRFFLKNHKKDHLNRPKSKPFSSKMPRCFMDITVDGEYLGRIEFELFDDVPMTSENFRCLCTGEKGFAQKRSNKPLHY